MYYLSHAQMAATMSGPARSLAIVTRAAAQDAVLGAVRGVVAELDPSLPVFDVQNLETIIAASMGRPRFTTTLLGLFALIGLALGASGIYGVLSYSVLRRTQEIGIRRALGAPALRLMQDVLRQGMLPVAIGLLAGLGASFWTTSLLRSQLFGVSPTDAITYAAVTLAVLVVAFTACLLPARRAAPGEPDRRAARGVTGAYRLARGRPAKRSDETLVVRDEHHFFHIRGSKLNGSEWPITM
jgi:putative ABC transport system permease protein